MEGWQGVPATNMAIGCVGPRQTPLTHFKGKVKNITGWEDT